MVVVFLTGEASRPDDLVPKSLRIVDDKGRVAIALSSTDAGALLLLLHEGKLRAAITGGAIATFELYARNGQNSRVELRVDEGDTPVLLMVDDHNVIRTQLAMGKDGKPNLK